MPTVFANWIRQITPEILEASGRSDWKQVPRFNPQEFSEALSKALNLDHLKIETGVVEWKNNQNFLTGLGKTPIAFSFHLSPLEGEITWVLPFEDLSKFTGWITEKNKNELVFTDPNQLKGFYQYILLESLAAISTISPINQFSPKIVEAPLPSEVAYCIDISLSYGGETLWGRLIADSTFERSLGNHFETKKPTLSTLKDFPELKIPLSLTLGSTELTKQEWDGVNEGDFLVLDDCRFHPSTARGTFTIMLQDRPIFQAKLRENQIKILDYLLHYEELPMSDDELPIEDELTPKPEEELPPVDQPQEPSIEEEPIVEEQEENWDIEEEPVAPAETSPLEQVALDQIPLKISVELARLSISLEELQQMKPGSQIPLNTHPEVVHLTIGNKAIGRGELVEVGELVGVKITEIFK